MKSWISVAVLLSLIGCASIEERPNESVVISTKDPVQAAIRDTAIDEDVLYLLMAAELAGQRNQYDLAMDAYLQAAKQVNDPRIAERAVKIGLFLKDEKRTQEALQIWLSKDANNLAARKFAVLVAIKNADHTAAVDNLDALFKSDPAGFEAGLLEIIKPLEKEGRSRFLFDVLESVAGSHPDESVILFMQALIASTMHDNGLAQEKISQVLRIQPNWAKALIFQAQLAGRAGDMEKARLYLEKAIKQSPDDEQLRKMLLEVLMDIGAHDDAIRLYQEVLDKKPDDGQSLFAIALIYAQQKQLERAEDYLERLLNNPEWQPQAAFYLGKIEQEQGHSERALKWYDKVGEGNFQFEANMAASALLLAQKRFDDVATRIGQVTAKNPEQALRLIMVKAEMFNGMARYQEAFDALTQALQDSSADNRDILYARALVAERMDKLDILEKDLLRIIETNADDVGALNALGYTLANKTTRYDDAARYLMRALELQPDDAVIIDSYGWLQFKLGNAEIALDYLKKAYAKQPENEIAAHIAEVLWSLGRQKQAMELFEAAFKRSPDDEYLLAFKRRFLQE